MKNNIISLISSLATSSQIFRLLLDQRDHITEWKAKGYWTEEQQYLIIISYKYRPHIRLDILSLRRFGSSTRLSISKIFTDILDKSMLEYNTTLR